MTTDPRATLARIRERADDAMDAPPGSIAIDTLSGAVLQMRAFNDGNLWRMVHGSWSDTRRSIVIWRPNGHDGLSGLQRLVAFAEAVLDLADPEYPPPPPDAHGAAGWRFAMEHVRSLAAAHLTGDHR